MKSDEVIVVVFILFAALKLYVVYHTVCWMVRERRLKRVEKEVLARKQKLVAARAVQFSVPMYKEPVEPVYDFENYPVRPGYWAVTDEELTKTESIASDIVSWARRSDHGVGMMQLQLQIKPGATAEETVDRYWKVRHAVEDVSFALHDADRILNGIQHALTLEKRGD